MSRVTTKPIFGVANQVRHKPGCMADLCLFSHKQKAGFLVKRLIGFGRQCMHTFICVWVLLLQNKIQAIILKIHVWIPDRKIADPYVFSSPEPKAHG